MLWMRATGHRSPRRGLPERQNLIVHSAVGPGAIRFGGEPVIEPGLRSSPRFSPRPARSELPSPFAVRCRVGRSGRSHQTQFLVRSVKADICHHELLACCCPGRFSFAKIEQQPFHVYLSTRQQRFGHKGNAADNLHVGRLPLVGGVCCLTSQRWKQNKGPVVSSAAAATSPGNQRSPLTNRTATCQALYQATSLSGLLQCAISISSAKF